MLAVIVILAVIALIAVPQVLKLINKSKDQSLEIVKKNMEHAAEAYVLDHTADFNLKTNEHEYIMLSSLENGYLKKVRDPYGNETCDGYVKVEKTSTYEYTAYLDCGGGHALEVASSYVNYGGNYLDSFDRVIQTSDKGYIAVGSSNSSKINNLTNKGTSNISDDAIIVKYDKDGNIEWENNFGGSNADYFTDVIEDGGNYTVLGYSYSTDGDLSGNNNMTAFVVQYDKKGKKISQKNLVNSVQLDSNRIIKDGDSYYISLGGRRLYGETIGAHVAYVVKYDSKFEKVWHKNYGGTYGANSFDLKKLTNGNIGLLFNSGSTDGDVEDIKTSDRSIYTPLIYEISSTDGSIENKGILDSKATIRSNSVVEVEDGYIAVGYGAKADVNDLQYYGGSDAYIVKFSKTLDSQGKLPILWAKNFGGSDNDCFYDITIKGDKVYAVGYSQSNDHDMSGVSNSSVGYATGIVVEYDLSGTVKNKTVIGGLNHDEVKAINITDDGFIISGTSFSTNGDFEDFNFGNSDAYIMKLTNSLAKNKTFKVKTLLKSKMPALVKSYGNSMPTSDTIGTLKLYTTNDPTKELGNWCDASRKTYDPNGNYKYVTCLQPFNNSDIREIYSSDIKTENTVKITADSNNWIKLDFHIGNDGSGHSMSNLKIKFKGSDPVTVEEAVEKGYIEPLAIFGESVNGDYYFPNSQNIITGGDSGIGNYPQFMIILKPKNKVLEQVTFNFNKAVSLTGGHFAIYQYNNFDISLKSSN